MAGGSKNQVPSTATQNSTANETIADVLGNRTDYAFSDGANCKIKIYYHTYPG